ncbi:MAG: hypothetical protein JNL08_11425 [Planctomycetes bacterium]|nr:hypothetical protein [Planctomycetota bacterium]
MQTSKGSAALTSDQWHVVHSRFMFPGTRHPFRRSIHSEWSDEASCKTAARALRRQLRADGKAAPVAEQDEVFVRKPQFKSLAVARHGADRGRRPRGSSELPE